MLGTLAFITTCLFLVIAIGVVVYALITRRRALAIRVGTVMLLWAGAYVACLLFVSLTAPQRIIGQGEEQCFDEMCFSVGAVNTTPTLGTPHDQITAQGIFYVVAVRLRNAGRGRAQRPSQPNLRVVDQRGRNYGIALDPEAAPGHAVGQPLAIAQLWDRQIQPGESVTHTVAFDLPVDITQPRLIITEGGEPTALIIGDENSFLHPQTAINLPPLHPNVP